MEYNERRLGPESYTDIVEVLSRYADTLLTERPEVVSVEPAPDVVISKASLACYIDTRRRLLDTSFTLLKTEPVDGGAAGYDLIRPALPDLPMSSVYSWQAGSDHLDVVVNIAGRINQTRVPASIANLQLRYLTNGTAYDPANEVRVCSLANTRQRLVKRDTLVKLGQKVGWYF